MNKPRIIPHVTTYTRVCVMDGPGAGGANHEYVVQAEDTGDTLAEISFQNGPVLENGVNGVTNEDLITIVIDRLQGFQSHEFACKENEQSLLKLEEALMWLRSRTRVREERGVEGKNIV